MHPFDQFNFCPKCGGRFVERNGKAKQCEACGFVYYFNPSAATVAVIVNTKKELLVCRRGKEPAKGTWDLPGGFVDMAESSEQGVAREVFEELGRTVVKAKYLFSLPNTYLYSGFLVHTVDAFFKCELDCYEQLKALDDVADSFWVPLCEVRECNFGLNSVRQGVGRLLAEDLL